MHVFMEHQEKYSSCVPDDRCIGNLRSTKASSPDYELVELIDEELESGDAETP